MEKNETKTQQKQNKYFLNIIPPNNLLTDWNCFHIWELALKMYINCLLLASFEVEGHRQKKRKRKKEANYDKLCDTLTELYVAGLHLMSTVLEKVSS